MNEHEMLLQLRAALPLSWVQPTVGRYRWAVYARESFSTRAKRLGVGSTPEKALEDALTHPEVLNAAEATP